MTNTDTSTLSGRLSWRRVGAAAGWGLIATVAMSALMGVATATGVSPMPKPIPAALIGQTVGPLAQPALLALAAVAHLVYGGLAAVLLAALARRVTVGVGLVWGGVLWVVASVAWLPVLGWGVFGVEQAAPIAVATLALHLVYGGVLGWLAGRARLA